MKKVIDLICFIFICFIFFQVFSKVGWKYILFVTTGSLIGGIILSLIFRKFQKIDSYYEKNVQKKYRFFLVYLSMIFAFVSSLAFYIYRQKGLFPTRQNDLIYTIATFSMIGLICGYFMSKFIKFNQKLR